MEKNLFRGIPESPYHLSVGAVLVDSKGQIACHYLKEFQTADQDTLLDFYLLMRETVESGESIEGAVLRGMKEEFGATGEIQKFLGTLVTKFPRGNVWIEKTTVYFLVQLIEFNLDGRLMDAETKESNVEWQSIDFLISKMEEQKKKYERTDLDESEILKRVKLYLP